MTRFFLLLALVATPAPVLAQEAPVQLSLDQRMLARCSAAFALVAQGQAAGDAAAQTYPDMRTRGSEFFVRAGARLMDEAGLSRSQLAEVMRREAQDMWDNKTLHDVMPACLPLLPAK